MKLPVWTTTEYASMRGSSRGLMRNHGPHDDQIARDSCGACALARRNYAGWLSVYIRAGEPVPEDDFAAELTYAAANNSRYYRAILRDLTTFGITFTI